MRLANLLLISTCLLLTSTLNLSDAIGNRSTRQGSPHRAPVARRWLGRAVLLSIGGGAVLALSQPGALQRLVGGGLQPGQYSVRVAPSTATHPAPTHPHAAAQPVATPSPATGAQDAARVATTGPHETAAPAPAPGTSRIFKLDGSGVALQVPGGLSLQGRTLHYPLPEGMTAAEFKKEIAGKEQHFAALKLLDAWWRSGSEPAGEAFMKLAEQVDGATWRRWTERNLFPRAQQAAAQPTEAGAAGGARAAADVDALLRRPIADTSKIKAPDLKPQPDPFPEVGESPFKLPGQEGISGAFDDIGKDIGKGIDFLEKTKRPAATDSGPTLRLGLDAPSFSTPGTGTGSSLFPSPSPTPLFAPPTLSLDSVLKNSGTDGKKP